MKKNPRLEERRSSIPKEIDIFVTRSFEIVDRIHEILQTKKLDQKDLARLLGKQESEISKWMSGTHNFTLKTLTRIEDVLKSSVFKVGTTRGMMIKNTMGKKINEFPLPILNPKEVLENLKEKNPNKSCI